MQIQVTISVKEITSNHDDDMWLYGKNTRQRDANLTILNSDCARLTFDGNSCYIKHNGRLLPLTQKSIVLDNKFIVNLSTQAISAIEQESRHTPLTTAPFRKSNELDTRKMHEPTTLLATTSSPSKNNRACNPNDALAFLFDSPLLINKTQARHPILTDQS